MRYRHDLPQLGDELFLTDSGLETILVFDHGMDLPLFASFPLLRSDDGYQLLEEYYATHVGVAVRHGTGCVLDTATWRASADWGAQLGFDSAALDAVNREAVALLEAVRHEHETPQSPIVINGVVGPRGDGYRPETAMSSAQAEAYHQAQVRTFADTGVDLVTAVTMTSMQEAIGVARAARREEVPVAISFTVETDGRLPTGQPLGSAVEAVDDATDGYPAYFMINCAHPTHFASELEDPAAWVRRVRGIRTNGSRLSHEELDAAEELDSEHPADLAEQILGLRRTNPQLTVLGGCCGTNHRHIDAIGSVCA